jgi:hypothetical protein
MAKTTDEYVFATILKRAADSGIALDKSKNAREWFRKKAASYREVNRDKLFKDAITTNRVIPGEMYMYVYDAKTADKLPYWDAFPLIFCTNVTKDGHEGINLHYLPPLLRAKLMDALYSTVNNKRFDATTKLRINYNILKSASSMRYFRPCYKKYLSSHVKSQFILVPAAEWDIALFLPTQNFKKASAENVWAESTNFDSGKSSGRRTSRAKFRSRFK